MNDMNGDYLWDRTGEPDPEIQQLEEVLGTLRYQPRPLEIPLEVPTRLQTGPTRFFSSSFASGLQVRFAIAAGIAVMLLGLGLWWGLHRRLTAELSKAGGKPSTTNTSDPRIVTPLDETVGPANEPRVNDRVAVSTTGGQERPDKPHLHRVNQQLARDMRRRLHNKAPFPANELQEAEAGKQQLMLALRVASSKLNFAQKKMLGTNPENLIHNQHKIG